MPNPPGALSTTYSNTAGRKLKSPATSTPTLRRALYKSPKPRSECQQRRQSSSSIIKPCSASSRNADSATNGPSNLGQCARLSQAPASLKPLPTVPTIHNLPHRKHEQESRLIGDDGVDGPRPRMQHHHQPAPPSASTGLPHTKHTQQLKQRQQQRPHHNLQPD